MRILPIVRMLSATAILACSLQGLAAVVSSGPPPTSVHPSARPPQNHDRLQTTRIGRIQVLTPVRRVPTTAGEHEALARKYEEKAATLHEVADVQRDLLAVLKTGPFDTGEAVSQDVARVRSHTRELIKDTDRLAAESYKAAENQRALARSLSQQ